MTLPNKKTFLSNELHGTVTARITWTTPRRQQLDVPQQGCLSTGDENAKSRLFIDVGFTTTTFGNNTPPLQHHWSLAFAASRTTHRVYLFPSAARKREVYNLRCRFASATAPLTPVAPVGPVAACAAAWHCDVVAEEEDDETDGDKLRSVDFHYFGVQYNP